MLLYLLIHTSIGKLVFYSPDSLSIDDNEIGYALFGNPGLYPVYGKIKPIIPTDCKITENIPSNVVPIIHNALYCYYSDLANSAYFAGAQLLLIMHIARNGIYEMSPKNYTEINNPDIITLLISDYFSEIIINESTVWVSYSQDFSKSNTPSLEIVFYNYYEENALKIPELIETFYKFDMNPSSFKFSISYVPSSAVYNKFEECIFFENQYYCALSTASFTGSEILMNSVLIMNYYNYLVSSDMNLDNFFAYLKDYYMLCPNNYSLTCNRNVMSMYTLEIMDNISVLTQAVNFNGAYTYMLINWVMYRSWGYLDRFYCRSMLEGDEKCPVCSKGCRDEIMDKQNCPSACNNTKCGYSNMQCLLKNTGCYYFMINDGNCNAYCINEEDCNKSSSSFNFSFIFFIVFTTGPVLILLIIM